MRKSHADEPRIVTHSIAGTAVEICFRCAGDVLIRTPAIYPVNAREWHGPYASEDAAIADFEARNARPRITRGELERLKRHDYYSIVDGVPMILTMDRWTGGTCLTTFELVDKKVTSA